MDEMIEQVAPTNVSLDDLEELINALSPDEIAELAECDPDVRALEISEWLVLFKLLAINQSIFIKKHFGIKPY